MNRIASKIFAGACTLALLSILSIGAWAQATHQVEVNRGTVVYASGNDLIVKMEDGMVKRFVVPSDYKLTVDGKSMGVSDLKPGTQLTQTITTTNEEQIVTDVRTVDVKVGQVNPPYLSVGAGDKIKVLRVPDGTKFTVNGKEMVLADLHEGMRIKGTVATAVPTSVMSRTRTVTGTAPAPKMVATPVLIGVLLIEEADETSK